MGQSKFVKCQCNWFRNYISTCYENSKGINFHCVKELERVPSNDLFYQIAIPGNEFEINNFMSSDRYMLIDCNKYLQIFDTQEIFK